MKSKKAVVLSLFLVLALLLGGIAGCAPKEEEPEVPTVPTAPEVEAYEFRCQHPWGAAENYFFEQYADIVRDMSGGRIDITIFCDGELIPGEDAARALAMGTIDMAFFHPCTYVGDIPAGAIEYTPFLFTSLDEVLAIVYQMGLEEEYRRLYKDKFDIYLLGCMPDDLGCPLWVDEFTCLADLDGRTNTFTGPMADIMSGFGVSPVHIAAGDLYTSLATGVLDGVSWGGAKCMMDMGFFEVAKYQMMPHYNLAFTPFSAMGVELWETLPADVQALLTQATYASGIYMRSTYAAAEAAALGTLVTEYGGTVVTLPDEDVRVLTAGGMDFLLRLKEEEPEAARAVDIVMDALRVFGRID